MIEILLQFVCEGCLKGFVVRDEDVENELSCPFSGPPPVVSAPGHLQLGEQLPFSPLGLFHPS